MAERETRRTFAFLPVTVHLETQGGLATPLVLRGTPLPAERVETFSTAADDQDTVEVKVLMGESRLASKNLSVGTFKLTGIPAQPKGVPKIRVRFRVDRTCVTTVAAEVGGTTVRADEVFEPRTDMSDEAIARMVSEAETAKGDDDSIVSEIEATNRAQGLIATAEARLKKSGDPGMSKTVADLGLRFRAATLTASEPLQIDCRSCFRHELMPTSSRHSLDLPSTQTRIKCHHDRRQPGRHPRRSRRRAEPPSPPSGRKRLASGESSAAVPSRWIPNCALC
jgi:hypothetical protein